MAKEKEAEHEPCDDDAPQPKPRRGGVLIDWNTIILSIIATVGTVFTSYMAFKMASVADKVDQVETKVDKTETLALDTKTAAQETAKVTDEIHTAVNSSTAKMEKRLDEGEEKIEAQDVRSDEDAQTILRLTEELAKAQAANAQAENPK